MPSQTPVVICDSSILVYSGKGLEAEALVVSYAVPRGFDVEAGVHMHPFRPIGTARKLALIEVQALDDDRHWEHVGMLEARAPYWKLEWKPVQGNRKALPRKSKYKLTVGQDILSSVEFRLGSRPLRLGKLTLDGKTSVPLHFGHCAVVLSEIEIKDLRPETCFPKRKLPIHNAGGVNTFDLSPILVAPKKVQRKKKPRPKR